MSEPFEIDGFRFCFPAWVLGERIDDLFQAEDADHNLAIQIFTDRTLAVVYRDNYQISPGEFVLSGIADPLTLLGLLYILQKKRTTHVTVNPTADASERPIAIGRFQERLGEAVVFISPSVD